MDALGTFSTEQKEYLDGFLRGLRPSAAAAAAPTTTAIEAPASDLPPGKRAQLAWMAAGKRLSKEEKFKFDADPLDCWPRIEELSAKDQLPEGEDLYRFKTHGLWNVSPAQASMMSRLRVPGGASISTRSTGCSSTSPSTCAASPGYGSGE